MIDSPSRNVTITAGQSVNFAGTGSDPDGNLPLSFLWQFGTGSGIANSTVEDPGLIQFNNPGTFTVTLTVTDALGLADPSPAARTITVQTASSGEMVPEWTNAEYPPLQPIDSGIVSNPVLTAADVSDATTGFVADPFLFHEGESWYMFFEAYNQSTQQGDIGLATSSDGLHWSYSGIVLNESIHVSYPFVFKFDGRYYMLPESYQAYQVRLYEAADFPYTWTHISTLATGRDFVDPTILRHNNKWWLFVSTTAETNCYLYYSDNLTFGWTQHPMSPVISSGMGSLWHTKVRCPVSPGSLRAGGDASLSRPPTLEDSEAQAWSTYAA